MSGQFYFITLAYSYFIGLITSLMGKLTLKIEKYVFIKYLKMYHFLFGLIHLFNLHHCNKLCRLYPYRCYQRHQKAIFLGRRFLLLIENWQSRTCIVHYPMCRTHSEMINGQTKSKYQNSLNFTFFFCLQQSLHDKLQLKTFPDSFPQCLSIWRKTS